MHCRLWATLWLAVWQCVSSNQKVNGNGERKGPAMVKIPGRTFTMGGEARSGAPGTREVRLQSYEIDSTPVLNTHFRQFVKETRYKTDAEMYGWSFVFNNTLSEARLREVQSEVKDAPQWVVVEASWWRQPEGRGSSLKGKWDTFPVVHISKTDAEKYCEWAGKRLPSEAEWENAARGKRKASLYPWGDGQSPMGPDGEWMMNIWQGDFPTENTVVDGYLASSPYDAFPSNSYGLYSTVGNVWEWTADFWPPPQHQQQQNEQVHQWVLKGGSFIDSIDGSFNHKATVVTRMGNTADSGSQNTGFRCAAGKGGGRKLAPPSQEEMQRKIEEGGVDALQEYLASIGHGGASVMPAAEMSEQLKYRQMARDRDEEL